MENLEFRGNIEICNNGKRCKKLIASADFHTINIFSEGLVAIEGIKNTLTMNVPIYLKCSITEITPAPNLTSKSTPSIQKKANYC